MSISWTGSGILSLFCKQAGAKKVYAIEASPLAKILSDVIKVNHAEDVIEVILEGFKW